ncbi:DnaJ sub C member 9 [Terramyces sp. JEL0728]|nr:DnaJ sub C member 9 [Terramyces sp. JEL0728]
MKKNLYEILELPETATTSEIKQKYKKLALLYHPDKNKDVDNEKIQDINLAYSCLIDPKKRQVYDRTKEIDEKEYDFYFKKINESDIAEYEKVYRYSEQERNDVFLAYVKTKGNLLDMIDHIPLSNYDDLDRYKEICQLAIDQGELSVYRQFPKINQKELKKRKTRLEKEKKQVQTENEKENELALKMEIQKRNESRLSALISNIEEKYCKEEKHKEEFEESKPKRRKADVE